jgi:hypothetical protein
MIRNRFRSVDKVQGNPLYEIDEVPAFGLVVSRAKLTAHVLKLEN